MSVSIHAKKIVKKYGELTIIPDLSVDIKNGEFFTLLGPSGCGKTTLLRMIAGFNSIEAGTISFNDNIINDIPAHKRNIGMVFQSYAIFPHMTVRENVEYGLKLRKVAKNELAARTDEILKTTRIEEYQDRLPERLSGGQQQRVALARAIVIHPSVLLMDEPLSNLDAKLRIEMRSAIRDVQKSVGITTVYVTHDQEEALAISDRIAVMNLGVIQQIGSPLAIYSRPTNVFVSTFIGHTNLLCGKIQIAAGETSVLLADGTKIVMNNLNNTALHGQAVVVGIRPEEFAVATTGIKATVVSSTFLGRYVNYSLKLPGSAVSPLQPVVEFSQDLGHFHKIFADGETIYLSPNADKLNVFTTDGADSLIKDVIKHG